MKNALLEIIKICFLPRFLRSSPAHVIQNIRDTGSLYSLKERLLPFAICFSMFVREMVPGIKFFIVPYT